MRMAARCARAIRRAGETAWLLRDGEQFPFEASVQHILPTGAVEGTVLGRGPGERASLYACPGETGGRLRAGDRILWRGERYRILELRAMAAGREVLYHWAALEREYLQGEEEEER